MTKNFSIHANQTILRYFKIQYKHLRAETNVRMSFSYDRLERERERMSKYCFDAAAGVVSLAVHSRPNIRFPIRRVFCVGQNYQAHAREMGSAKADPFFFSKPTDAVVDLTRSTHIHVPLATADYQHEVELVVALGEGVAHGLSLTPEEAGHAIWGYAIGLDMTCRDLQAEAKKNGRPWDLAKGADESAPIGPVFPRESLDSTGVPASNGSIRLMVNGEQRQVGHLSDMTLKPPELIAFLSKYVRLKPGDLIFTGTPAGVGSVAKGDVVVAQIAGLDEIKVTIQ